MSSPIKLTIDNSLCRIEGLSITQFKALRELVAYTVDGSYFASNVRASKRYLLDAKGTFPTGLLYIVKRWLDTCPFPDHYETIDKRRKPPATLNLTCTLPHPPYPEQHAAVEACVKAGRGIVCAPTGSGKSTIIAMLIHRLRVPTLVVVPTLELKRQLTASLRAAFGEMANIRVENVDALDPNAVTKGYDCVIIDEFHHSAAATYRKLNRKAWTGVYYKFGFTATPFRSQDSERLLLESVLSQVIYKLEHKTAVERKLIVPIEAYYYDLPKQPLDSNSWPEVYSKLIVNNVYRNKLIHEILVKIHVNDRPSLCLVKEISHGNILSSTTGHPFANGQEGNNTRQHILDFNLRNMNTLIGTTGVLGEGVDTRPAEYIIIAGGGKSRPAFMQQCGRGFRVFPGKESCKIILFKDSSHRFLLRHFNAQVKTLRDEYGISPVKLPLPSL